MKFYSSLLIPTLTITTLGVLILGGVIMDGKGEEIMENGKASFTTQQTYNVGGIGFIQGLGATECSITPECTAPDCLTITVAKIGGDGLDKENTCKSFKIPTTTWEKAKDGGTTSVNSVLSAKGFDPIDWVVDNGLLCKGAIGPDVIITDQFDCKLDGKTATCKQCKEVGRPDPDCDYDGDGVSGRHDCNDDNIFIKPGSKRSAGHKGICSSNMETCEGVSGKRIAYGNQVKPKTEICNGVDDDCDGLLNEGLPMQKWYRDNDKDGFGDNTDQYGLYFCNDNPGKYIAPTLGIQSPWYAPKKGDCDDKISSVNPQGKEICDSFDNNCNGLFNENNVCGEITKIPDLLLDWFGDNLDAMYKKLIARYKTTHFLHWEKTKNDSTVAHKNKPSEKLKTDRINFDIGVQAIKKYLEGLDKEIVLCGFSSIKQFEQQATQVMNLMETIGKEEKILYSKLDDIRTKRDAYNKKIEKIDTENVYTNKQNLEKDIQDLKKYQELLQKAVDPKEYAKAVAYLKNPKVSSPSEIENYLTSINYVVYASKEGEKLDKQFPKITHLKNYLSAIEKVNNETGTQNVNSRVSYLQQHDKWLKERIYKSGIDVFGFFNRQKQCTDNGRYDKYQDAKKLEGMMLDPTNPKSFFPAIAAEANIQFEKQKKIDERFINFKLRSLQGQSQSQIYHTAVSIIGLRNGAVDFFKTNATNLRILMSSIGKTDAETLATIDLSKSYLEFLKFNVSSASKEPLIKNGQLNMYFENTVNQVGGAVSDFLLTLGAAKSITLGLQKATLVGINNTALTIENAASLGMFSTYAVKETAALFTEGKLQGLDDKRAFGFALLGGVTQGAVSLISPNDIIMGRHKNLLTNLGANTGKKILPLFAKHYAKEVFKENVEEALQLTIQSALNRQANDLRDTQFDASFTREKYAETAIITSLTVGIVGVDGSLKAARAEAGTLPLEQVVKIIISDSVMYNKYISSINDIIDGKRSIEGISIQKALELRKYLEMSFQYYNNKESKFDFKIIDTINNSKLRNLGIDAVRAKIIQLVKQHVGIDITLSDAQMDLIQQAHKINSVMGEITMQQLIAKIRLLHQAFDEIIYTDVKTEKNKEAITRLLLEAGICGQTEINPINILGDINEYITRLSEQGLDRNNIYKRIIENLIVPYIEKFLISHNLQGSKFMIGITGSDGRSENDTDSSIPEFIIYFDENVKTSILNPSETSSLSQELEKLWKENNFSNLVNSNARFETNPFDPINSYYLNPKTPTPFPTRFRDLFILYDQFNLYEQLKGEYLNNMNNESSDNQKKVKDNFSTAMTRLGQNDGSDGHLLYNYENQSVVYGEKGVTSKMQIGIKQSALRIMQYGISNIVYDLSILLNNNNGQFEDYFGLNTFDKLQTLETEISHFQTFLLEKINQQVDANKKAKMNGIYKDLFGNNYSSTLTKASNAYAYFLNMHNMHQVVFNKLYAEKNSPTNLEEKLLDYNISKNDLINNSNNQSFIIYIPLNILGSDKIEFQSHKENILTFGKFVQKINEKKGQLLIYFQ